MRRVGKQVSVGSLAGRFREKAAARRRLRRLSPQAAQRRVERVLLPRWWRNVSRDVWVEDLA